MLRPCLFYNSTSLHEKIYQFLDHATKYGDFCHKERKETQRLCVLCVRILCERCVEKRSTGCFNAKNAEETQRPQRLCELFGLCVPQDLIAEAMTFSEMTVLAMDEILLRTEISRMRGRRRRGAGRPNGPGTGTAATRAALAHDTARFHFGTGRSGWGATCCDRASSTILHLYTKNLQISRF